MFRNYKYFSSGVSVLFHILLFTFLLAGYRATNNPNASLIEVGLGGDQGGGGGGAPDVKQANPEEKIPTKEPTEKTKKEVSKPKPKEVEGTGTTVNPTTGTGTGGGPGTGSGTGTGGGNLGIPIVKPVVPKPPVSEVYLVAVEQMPEPMGGMESIKDKIPPSVKSGGAKGTVYVLAYIDEYGVVRKVLLSKGIGGDADQAALRAVRETHFRAGRKAGVPVKVQMILAISI
ncbi:MAG: energy transducer TonB [Ignavibacteriaceae bacterium]|nr:energy transducer TonB [Ignavibacteriaceae bacterium]